MRDCQIGRHFVDQQRANLIDKLSEKIRLGAFIPQNGNLVCNERVLANMNRRHWAKLCDPEIFCARCSVNDPFNVK